MRQLMLVGAVVIHYPNFFVSAARANERDLGAGNSREASTQTRNNVVGKLMGQAPGFRLRGAAAIDFLQHRGRGGVLRTSKRLPLASSELPLALR